MSPDEISTELDSHADTCVVGAKTCLVTHDFGKTVKIHGYAPTVGATSCKVVSAVIAYDDPTNGQVWMLTLHQAILVPEITSNLLGTMQLRDNGILINDQPKYQAATPTNDHHSIFAPAANDETDELRIPLRLKGVTHYFTSRVPTVQEFESTEQQYCITLTAEAPEWDPNEDRFGQMEDDMLDSRGKLKQHGLSPLLVTPSWAVAAVWCHPHEREPHYDFPSELASRVMLRNEPEVGINHVHSSKRSKAIGPQTLAKHWNIGLAAAERTYRATSQNALRTVLHPTLSRRFRTNDRQLRYRRIPHEMFTDTMEASVPSWFRQNKYAQVYCTRFGSARAYPMKKKAHAHETFSLLAQREGVPTKLIFDGSKEQTIGAFRKKVKETGTHTHTVLPYSPWSNAAEGAIREMKKGA